MTKTWRDIHDGRVAAILSLTVTEEHASAAAIAAEKRAAVADGDAAMLAAMVERDAWYYKAALIKHQRQPTHAVRLFAARLDLERAHGME